MKNLIKSLVAISCISLILIASCSDKNSLEACRYQTTMELDKGNYDAVLQSPCASTMQLGAAYFGKAGYDITTVINTLITANAGSTTQTDLYLYLTSLTKVVTDSTLTNLDLAATQYNAILPSDALYQDAQFFISIIEAVKTMSLIKTVTDPNGTGTLSSCNINGNTNADEVDAVVCALLVSGTTPTSGSCPGALSSFATYTTTTADITFSATTGTYRGLIVTMTPSTPSASCPSDYKKLLYFNTADNAYYAATTAGICTDSDGQSWPCPLTSNLDLVETLQTSINDSVNALSTAITGTSSSDVVLSIRNIQTDACVDQVCTSEEIATYIQTQL